jgi:hypothetical protein
MSTEKQTFYSTDNEYFNFESIGDLFDELDGEGTFEEGRAYYEAEGKRLMYDTVVTNYRVTSLLEGIDEAVYDEIGDTYHNDFIDVDSAAQEELRQLIVKWAEKHVRIEKYYVLEAPSILKRVTKEDVEDYKS